jgi:hypothetical protein
MVHFIIASRRFATDAARDNSTTLLKLTRLSVVSSLTTGYQRSLSSRQASQFAWNLWGLMNSDFFFSYTLPFPVVLRKITENLIRRSLWVDLSTLFCGTVDRLSKCHSSVPRVWLQWNLRWRKRLFAGLRGSSLRDQLSDEDSEIPMNFPITDLKWCVICNVKTLGLKRL